MGHVRFCGVPRAHVTAMRISVRSKWVTKMNPAGTHTVLAYGSARHPKSGCVSAGLASWSSNVRSAASKDPIEPAGLALGSRKAALRNQRDRHANTESAGEPVFQIVAKAVRRSLGTDLNLDDALGDRRRSVDEHAVLAGEGVASRVDDLRDRAEIHVDASDDHHVVRPADDPPAG